MKSDSSTQLSPTSLEIVREPERRAATKLSRVTWWRMERTGLAPKRVRLSANTVGWLKHEIEAWIAERAAARAEVRRAAS